MFAQETELSYAMGMNMPLVLWFLIVSVDFYSHEKSREMIFFIFRTILTIIVEAHPGRML